MANMVGGTNIDLGNSPLFSNVIPRDCLRVIRSITFYGHQLVVSHVSSSLTCFRPRRLLHSRAGHGCVCKNYWEEFWVPFT